MELIVKRIFLGDAYTIGKLYVNGEYLCDTLEDKVLDTNKNGKFDEGNKVKHHTAIPYGTYDLIVNYSPKFKRELPRLLNVPYFEGILIHEGNTNLHTSGCILLGENKVKGKVINSKKYVDKLIRLLKEDNKKHIINIE